MMFKKCTYFAVLSAATVATVSIFCACTSGDGATSVIPNNRQLNTICGSVRIDKSQDSNIVEQTIVFVSNGDNDVTYEFPKIVTAVFDGDVVVPRHIVLSTKQKLTVTSNGNRAYNLRFYGSKGQLFGGIIVDAYPDSYEFNDIDDRIFLTCSINPRVNSIITVLPSPNYCLCGADGHFQLPYALPKGRYHITFKLHGYETHTHVVDINESTLPSLNVMLKKANR